MGAASVTGVGQGVAANLKGPGNNRNYSVPEVCPHVVCAGTVTTSVGAGTATVTFPDHLALPAASYAVILQVDNAAAAGHGASVTDKTDNGAGLFTSFAILSEVVSETVEWMVVRMGWGVEVHV